VASEGGEYGWQSEVPGQKTPRPVVVVAQTGSLPATMGALLMLRPDGNAALALEQRAESIILRASESKWIEITKTGDPVVSWVK
jgi:hypothetical protein